MVDTIESIKCYGELLDKNMDYDKLTSDCMYHFLNNEAVRKSAIDYLNLQLQIIKNEFSKWKDKTIKVAQLLSFMNRVNISLFELSLTTKEILVLINLDQSMNEIERFFMNWQNVDYLVDNVLKKIEDYKLTPEIFNISSKRLLAYKSTDSQQIESLKNLIKVENAIDLKQNGLRFVGSSEIKKIIDDLVKLVDTKWPDYLWVNKDYIRVLKSKFLGKVMRA